MNNKFKQTFIKLCIKIVMLHKLNITPPDLLLPRVNDPPLFGNKQENTYEFVDWMNNYIFKSPANTITIRYGKYKIANNIFLTIHFSEINNLLSCVLFDSAENIIKTIPINVLYNLIDKELLLQLCNKYVT